LDKPHLESNFYIPAALFLVLWSALLVMLFTARLRGGLTRRVQDLANELATAKVSVGLFPEIEQDCLQFQEERNRLDAFLIKIDAIRSQYAGSSELGSVKA